MRKVSIIIPHYNSQNTLERLLKTIPAFPWIEVIVVDDHSKKPFSYEFKAKFQHVIFLDNQKDQKGAGAARNIGLLASTGEWIIFADSDDLFTENAFDLIKTLLYSKSELILFYPTSFNTHTNSEGDRHRYIELLMREYEETSKISVLYKFLVVWSAMISKQLILNRDLKFDNYISGQDMVFSTKMKYYANEISINGTQPIYCITQGQESLSNLKSEQAEMARFYATCDVNRFLKEHGIRDAELPVNFRIYNLRHYGALKVIFAIIYAVKNRSSLFKGTKFLVKRIMNKST